MIKEGTNIITEHSRIIENLGVYQVPGLRYWYDASALPLSDGTKVSSVSDKAGSGFNLTQVDVKRQPTYRTNQINGLGSVNYELNTVDFTSGNQGTLFGSKSGQESFFNGRVVEFFWVARFNAIPTTFAQFFQIRYSTVVPTVTMRLTNLGRFSLNLIDDNSVSVLTSLSNTLSVNTWYLFYCLVDFSGTFNRTLEVEGVGSVSATSSNPITISNQHNLRFGASGNTIQIDSPEQIITSNPTALSVSDKSIIVNYLKSKYNINYGSI